jgi:hypothetical protein
MKETMVTPSRPSLTAFAGALALTVLLGLLACSSGSHSPTEPTPRPTLVLDLSLETAHFLLQYVEENAQLMDRYAEALEGSYERILHDLGRAQIGRVTGRFYPNRASFTAATGWDATGAVQGRSMFSVVASPFDPSLPVHEFVHNVTLHLNPDGDEPVWLWEAVAVYEAGQFVDPANIPCMANGQFPSLASLGRQGECNIYAVGYTIIEFILDRWDMAVIRELIVSNGNIPDVLGVSTADFEAEWHEFVEEQYL